MVDIGKQMCLVASLIIITIIVIIITTYSSKAIAQRTESNLSTAESNDIGEKTTMAGIKSKNSLRYYANEKPTCKKSFKTINGVDTNLACTNKFYCYRIPRV